jgi:hypothetical protein
MSRRKVPNRMPARLQSMSGGETEELFLNFAIVIRARESSNDWLLASHGFCENGFDGGSNASNRAASVVLVSRCRNWCLERLP